MTFQLGANFWQSPAKLQNAMEFILIANLAPLGVINVLLATARISASGLNMAARITADPDAGPSGRYRQLPNACEGLLIGYRAVRGP